MKSISLFGNYLLMADGSVFKVDKRGNRVPIAPKVWSNKGSHNSSSSYRFTIDGKRTTISLNKLMLEHFPEECYKTDHLKTSDDEEFGWITGYEGLYKVGSSGQVISYIYDAVNGRVTGRKAVNGYQRVSLKKDKKDETFLIHRLVAEHFLTDFEPELQIDHINRVRDDNSVTNLRMATTQQNSRNTVSRVGSTSKYKGVNWDKERNKWASKITIDGKTKFLGRFETELEAHHTYRDFVSKNFSPEMLEFFNSN